MLVTPIGGVVGFIEQFTYADPDLRLHVVYVYYDENEQPLYVGASKDFYNAHYFNSQRLGSFFDDIKYVGFYKFPDEITMKKAKKIIVKNKKPIYNSAKYEKVKALSFEPDEELVVLKEEMEETWREA